MEKKKILSVGNCDFDAPQLKMFIESNTNSKVIEAKTIEKAKEKLNSNKFDLIIVNRVGAFDNLNGLILIDYVIDKRVETPIMLITNFKEKMEEALKHGAVQGFGKAEINSKKTIKLINNYV